MMSKKQEMIERLKNHIEAGKIVIPSSFPIEELIQWNPQSDADLALRYAFRDSGECEQ